MEATALSELIKTYSSIATLSNLTTNLNSDFICFVKETDQGRFRTKIKVSGDSSNLSFDVVAEDPIAVAKAYRSTDKIYQISKSGLEVYKGVDGKLQILNEDGSSTPYCDLIVDHFSFIEPTDEIVAVLDERVVVRIDTDGQSEVLFDDRESHDDYFVADPVASQSLDMVVFRFWRDFTMPFFSSSLKAISLTNGEELDLDLYPSPIYSQPQVEPSGRYFSYIAVVDDHLKIVVHEGKDRYVISAASLDQGDYDYGFGQRTYCLDPHARAIYYQNYSDGYSTLFRYDLSSKTSTQLEFGHFELPSPLKVGVVAIRNGAKTPTNITAVIAKSSTDGSYKSEKRILFECYPRVERSTLSEPENLNVTYHDSQGYDVTVNGHIYRSKVEKGLVVQIHSGPVGASKVTWNPRVPLLNQLGFTVVTFNQRGSSGYGHSFMLSILGHHGTSDVEDCLAVVERVASSSKSKGPIFLSGSSAAGIVTLGVASKVANYERDTLSNDSEGDRLIQDQIKGVVLSAPVVDIEYTHLNTHRFEGKYFEHLIGPYPSSKSAYAARSPLNMGVEIPTLIIHGTDDPVVPLQSVANYVTKNPKATLEVMEGYGHGFNDPEGQRRELELITNFIAAQMN